jgi:hypothetical protein
LEAPFAPIFQQSGIVADRQLQPADRFAFGSANRRELVNRTEKAESVASLKEVFKASKVVVVAH